MNICQQSKESPLIIGHQCQCPSIIGHLYQCPSIIGNQYQCPSIIGHQCQCPFIIGHQCQCPSIIGHQCQCPLFSVYWSSLWFLKHTTNAFLSRLALVIVLHLQHCRLWNTIMDLLQNFFGSLHAVWSSGVCSHGDTLSLCVFMCERLNYVCLLTCDNNAIMQVSWRKR